MFNKKQKRYIRVTTYNDGDVFVSDAYTAEEWQGIGFGKSKDQEYYLFEPEKLQEVDLSLIISNK